MSHHIHNYVADFVDNLKKKESGVTGPISPIDQHYYSNGELLIFLIDWFVESSIGK